MLATPGVLLTHVPPEAGLAVIVVPIHNVAEGVVTIGSAFTVTVEVVLLQPVAVSIKVKVIVPAETLVTNPVLSIVATVGSLLTHAPPTPGLALIVEPMHKVADDTLTVGAVFTVTFEVVALQPVAVSVKVNVTVPADIPVINPALSMVAIAGALLIHVPPVPGLPFSVDPTHKVTDDVLTVGSELIVMVEVVALQPVAVSVNVNVTLPAVIPVISPVLSMVATEGVLLIHAPPVPGLAFIVAPIHNVPSGMLTAGRGVTVTVEVIALQPVAVSVKVKVEIPAEIPVTNPALSMIATEGVLLTQVPPVPGLALMVAPVHNVGDGTLTVGIVLTVTVEVVALQPVDVSVKVKVAEPADIPVINPALSMVATAGALLTHVPPVPGLAVIVAPTHKVADGVLTTGIAFTVTVEVVALQPVAVSVKVKVTVPADTPVTNPALFMVAIAGALLIHVPPTPGLAVTVAPTHNSIDDMFTVGTEFTVTVEVVLLQPVAVSVYVKVTLPADIPVITPELSIVATAGALLTHVPPVPGLAVIVAPTHNVADGVLTTGIGLTVILDVVLMQPVAVSVKVKVTMPADIPVTNPALLMVAIAGALLTHVPPTPGLVVIVAPTHNVADGVLTTGSGFTVMLEVVLLQPEAVEVNVKVTLPADIPVINPALLIVATAGALLTHVPPTPGLAINVAPTHNVADGVLTTGSAFTVTEGVVLLQPVAVEIKVKVTVPADIPVINPALLIVATAGELLTHVPPTPGLVGIVAPTHNVADGVFTTGSALTVTVEVVLLQPVAVEVNVKVTVPADIPVINPVLLMVATAGALLTHVPPTPGLAVMVAPTHNVADGVLTTGSAFTVTDGVVLLQPVAVEVKVKVTVPIEIPVTNPALLIVATAGALLTHVPPTPGLAVMVAPTHNVADGVLTTGSAFTVTDGVVLLQPVVVEVNVKVTVPADIPVINPALLIVATAGELLTHVPPTPGLAVNVAPTHNVADGVLTTGSAFTVTEGVVLLQPVAVEVKVKVTVPADIPVINPALLIVATAGALLTHVPPTPGLAVIVAPTHNVADGVLTTGSAFTVTEGVVLLQPVAVEVNVKATLPADIPVTKPALLMVATPGALLTQVPPTPGLAFIVAPTHNVADGVLTTGRAFTVTVGVVLIQPVVVDVKVKVTVPADIPVINPALLIVAIAGALLTHVPPAPGLAVIVAPTHNVANGTLTTGSGLMVILIGYPALTHEELLTNKVPL